MWSSPRMWLGLAVAVVCLALSFVGIDLGEVGAILRQTKPAWLAAALLMVIAATLVRGLRWRILLLQDGSASQASSRVPGVLRLTNIWLAGASLNLALPIPRSGDVARAYLAGEAGGISKALALGTVAAEKLLDVVMLAICFLLLLPLVALPTELAARQTSIVGAAVVLIALVGLVLWQRNRLLAVTQWFLARLPWSWTGRLASSLERGVQGLEALRSPRAVLWLAFWSVVVWLMSVAINSAIFLALGLPASWTASLFVLVVLQAGVALPSTPGKVGVFQVLCRWSLVFLGYSAALGLAYGILLYLVSPVFYMVVGALALVGESWRLRRTTSTAALKTFRSEVTGGQSSRAGGDEGLPVEQSMGTPL